MKSLSFHIYSNVNTLCVFTWSLSVETLYITCRAAGGLDWVLPVGKTYYCSSCSWWVHWRTVSYPSLLVSLQRHLTRSVSDLSPRTCLLWETLPGAWSPQQHSPPDFIHGLRGPDHIIYWSYVLCLYSRMRNFWTGIGHVTLFHCGDIRKDMLPVDGKFIAQIHG